MSDPAPVPTPSPPTARSQRTVDEFVRLWGDMASAWGVNRTMAQIHALLYASERPLDTDEIMERLEISRGNANMNLRALVDWSLIRKTHQEGSRRDYFVAEKDVWAITTTIIEERRRREIQPVQRALDDLVADLRAGDDLTADERALAERIGAFVDFMDTFEGFTTALLPLLRGRNVEKVHKLVQYAARLRGRSAPNGAAGGAAR